MAGAFFCLKIPRLSYLAGLCSFYGNKNVPIGRAHMEPPWIFSFQSLVHLCEVKCKLLPSWAQHFSQLSKEGLLYCLLCFDQGSFIFMIFARMFQHNSVFVQRYMWHITLYTLLLLIVVHRRQKNVGNNGKQTLGFNFVWERAFHSFKSFDMALVEWLVFKMAGTSRMLLLLAATIPQRYQVKPHMGFTCKKMTMDIPRLPYIIFFSTTFFFKSLKCAIFISLK